MNKKITCFIVQWKKPEFGWFDFSDALTEFSSAIKAFKKYKTYCPHDKFRIIRRVTTPPVKTIVRLKGEK